VVVLFVSLCTTITFVYSQMRRDPTLSNLTGTTPNELGSDFWFKLIGFGVGPELGLVASVFQEFTGFLFSWVQPGLASINDRPSPLANLQISDRCIHPLSKRIS
jgi:hypothetical protein